MEQILVVAIQPGFMNAVAWMQTVAMAGFYIWAAYRFYSGIRLTSLFSRAVAMAVTGFIPLVIWVGLILGAVYLLALKFSGG